MLFSDEKRFSSELVQDSVDNQIVGRKKSSTEQHVGPGSYLAEQFEQKRNGWNRQNFSNRQPMTEPKGGISRSEFYTSGVIAKNGTMASPSRSKSPGPGHYESAPTIFSFPSDPRRKKDLNITSLGNTSVHNMSTRNSTMSSSDRFAFSNSACLSKGVVLQSAANNKSAVGPGSYAVPRNDFIKKSYNVRVRNGNTRSPAGNASPGSSSNSVTGSVNGSVTGSGGRVKPTTTPRSVSRPSSAGSTRTASSAGGGGSTGGAGAGGLGSGARRSNTTRSSSTPRSPGAAGGGGGGGYGSASKQQQQPPQQRALFPNSDSKAPRAVARSPAAAAAGGGGGGGFGALPSPVSAGAVEGEPMTQQEWQQAQQVEQQQQAQQAAEQAGP
mmetsp:Transcript_10681/g.17419  ORF Transcript_10681/g.17419 Transcript_10681/m.17419 type:complete len:383 (-) Transcript_10681:369-1517(-)